MSNTDKPPIPAVIPEVEWVDGEPVIAREQVVRKSPIPNGLAAFLLLMALFSVGYTVYQQDQRNNDRSEQRIGDEADDRRVEGLVEDLQRQQERAERERERLRLLVLGILTAENAAERDALLREFAEEVEAQNDANAVQDADDPPGQPSTNDDGVTEPQGQGVPSPQVPSPGPAQQPNPAPSPTPGSGSAPPPAILDVPPLPVPLPAPIGSCIDTLPGRICR